MAISGEGRALRPASVVCCRRSEVRTEFPAGKPRVAQPRARAFKRARTPTLFCERERAKRVTPTGGTKAKTPLRGRFCFGAPWESKICGREAAKKSKQREQIIRSAEGARLMRA